MAITKVTGALLGNYTGGSADDTVVVGDGAGVAITTGVDNTFIGDTAGAATTEGVKHEAALLVLKKRIEAAARMGEKTPYKDPITGEEKEADFTGVGDIDQTRKELDFAKESADSIAQSMLDIRKKYGTEFVKQSLEELELSDPQFRKVRDALGKAALEDVESGYALAPGMREEIQQAERAGQYARGNVFGAAPAAAEAFGVGNAAFRLRQQRLANAASYLSGTTPVAQFGQIAGAQQGAAPFQPMWAKVVNLFG